MIKATREFEANGNHLEMNLAAHCLLGNTLARGLLEMSDKLLLDMIR